LAGCLRITNGQFGDLRNYVQSVPKVGVSEKQVRKFTDLEFKVDKLLEIINANKGKGKKIKEVIIKTSPDFSISL
jgi:CRISPR-associated protein Csh2